MARNVDTDDAQATIREGDTVEVAFQSYPGETPKEVLRGTVSRVESWMFEFVPTEGSADYWDTYCHRDSDRVRVYKDSGTVFTYHPDRGTKDKTRLGQRAEFSVPSDEDDEDAVEWCGSDDCPVCQGYTKPPEWAENPSPCSDRGEDSDEVRTDGGEESPTYREGVRVAVDEWGVGTVTERPQDRTDGQLRIRFDRPARNLTFFVNRPVEDVALVEEGADTADPTTADADCVEFVVQFEKPVSAADLYETFQDLADAAAAEGEEFEDVDDDVLPDGGSPVDSAAAFEKALQSFVEEAIVDGVHPSDASTLLFAEANRIAGAMWSHDRDDAEILP